MMDRRHFLYGSLLLGGGVAAAVARRPSALPPISQRALEAAVPSSVGMYRVVKATDVVLPSRDELSERIYDRFLARGFVAPDQPPIMLVIAYGSTQDYGLQLHRPESCYPASGWSLSGRRPVRLGMASGGQEDAVLLDAARGARRETILYWTRIGNRFPVSAWGGRLDILRAALAKDLPDGVLVRLSTPSGAGGDFSTLEGFNRMLLQKTSMAGRRLLLGSRA